MDENLCDRLRQALLDGGGLEDVELDGVLEAEELRAHVPQCEACRRAASAWPRAARALAQLPRRRAPGELDSAVVGALQAGARTERALDALRSLARLAPPQQLDVALEAPLADAAPPSAPGRAPAPRVLDRLVNEELVDPAKARVRRHVGGLRRLRAPEDLAPRLAARMRAQAAAADDRPFAGLSGPREGSADRRARWIVVAAMLAVLAVLPITLRDSEPQVKTRPFVVEQAAGLDALSPMARSLLDSASSGLSNRRS